jgi:hypothetical protein
VAAKWGSANGRTREDRCLGWEREVWCVQLVCSGEPAGWEVLEVQREVRLG